MKISIRQIERATSYFVKDWPGACGVICNRIIESELVEGKVIEGNWLGIINFDPKYTDYWLSEHFLRQDEPCHCWILLKSGEILDPTRWVFEGVKPYIYQGANNNQYKTKGAEQ